MSTTPTTPTTLTTSATTNLPGQFIPTKNASLELINIRNNENNQSAGEFQICKFVAGIVTRRISSAGRKTCVTLAPYANEVHVQLGRSFGTAVKCIFEFRCVWQRCKLRPMMRRNWSRPLPWQPVSINNCHLIID